MSCNNQNNHFSEDVYIACVAAIQDNPVNIPPSIIPDCIIAEGINNSNITAPVKFSGAYNGSKTINVPCSFYISILNTSCSNSLSFEINGLILILPPLTFLNEYFTPFNNIIVTAIDSYVLYTK